MNGGLRNEEYGAQAKDNSPRSKTDYQFLSPYT